MKVVARRDEPARGCFRIGDGRYKIVYWDNTVCYVSAEEVRANPVIVSLVGAKYDSNTNNHDSIPKEELEEFTKFALARMMEQMQCLVNVSKSIYNAWKAGRPLEEPMEDLAESLESMGIFIDEDGEANAE